MEPNGTGRGHYRELPLEELRRVLRPKVDHRFEGEERRLTRTQGWRRDLHTNSQLLPPLIQKLSAPYPPRCARTLPHHHLTLPGAPIAGLWRRPYERRPCAPACPARATRAGTARIPASRRQTATAHGAPPGSPSTPAASTGAGVRLSHGPGGDHPARACKPFLTLHKRQPPPHRPRAVRRWEQTPPQLQPPAPRSGQPQC